jgi:hypothetical protein
MYNTTDVTSRSTQIAIVFAVDFILSSLLSPQAGDPLRPSN